MLFFLNECTGYNKIMVLTVRSERTHLYDKDFSYRKPGQSESVTTSSVRNIGHFIFNRTNSSVYNFNNNSVIQTKSSMGFLWSVQNVVTQRKVL